MATNVITKNPATLKTKPDWRTCLAELVKAPASCGKSALIKYNQAYPFFIDACPVLLVVYFFDAINFSSHVLVVFSAGLLCFVDLNTVGVNSPYISWMPVIPVAALMLMGVRWSLFWLFLIVIFNLVLFASVALNAISGQVMPENFSLEQTILTKLNVIVFLIVAIALYDWMRNAKLRDLAARNAELLETHGALRAAQTHRDDFIGAVGISYAHP